MKTNISCWQITSNLQSIAVKKSHLHTGPLIPLALPLMKMWEIKLLIKKMKEAKNFPRETFNNWQSYEIINSKEYIVDNSARTEEIRYFEDGTSVCYQNSENNSRIVRLDANGQIIDARMTYKLNGLETYSDENGKRVIAYNDHGIEILGEDLDREIAFNVSSLLGPDIENVCVLEDGTIYAVTGFSKVNAGASKIMKFRQDGKIVGEEVASFLMLDSILFSIYGEETVFSLIRGKDGVKIVSDGPSRYNKLSLDHRPVQVKATPQGKFLVTIDEIGRLRIVDLRDGKTVKVIENLPRTPQGMKGIEPLKPDSIHVRDDLSIEVYNPFTQKRTIIGGKK